MTRAEMVSVREGEEESGEAISEVQTLESPSTYPVLTNARMHLRREGASLRAVSRGAGGSRGG